MRSLVGLWTLERPIPIVNWMAAANLVMWDVRTTSVVTTTHGVKTGFVTKDPQT